MLLRILFTITASLGFLFFFWRKLKEDYTQNQIFTTGFYSLFGIFVSSVFANFYAPYYVFWITLFGSLVGLIAGINRFRFRLFESIEAWVSGSMAFVFFIYLYLSILKFELFSAYAAFTMAFLVFLFLFLDKYYKKFKWYKSGRVGFSGFFALGLFFLIRSLVALLFPNMLFFVGKTDAIISGVLAFFSFVTVYNLARIESR